MLTRPVYIAGSIRTPFMKSMTAYRQFTTQELMTMTLQGLVEKYQLHDKILGDVALGAVMKSAFNWNLARECVLGTTLSPYTPGYTLQRACGTSLEAASQLALKIGNYQIDVGIAGGVDTNSDLPIALKRSMAQKLLSLHQANTWLDKAKVITSFRAGDFVPAYPAVVEPRTHLSMGEHCELMVQEWHISQAEQDEIALASHRNGDAAYKNGFYDDLIMPVLDIKRDGLLRADTSMEKLARLKPAFAKPGIGTLTAGNSSPLTDGSAAVLLVSEAAAKAGGYPLLARFVDAQVAAVDFVHGDGLLMAPTFAVNELLKRHKLTLQDFDFYEIHEAFAGQVLCTLKAWESDDYCRKVLKADSALGPIDRTKLNVNGSSIALGHPFAATGARILGTLAKMLSQRGHGRGLISICTAGGMGIAAIVEAI